MKRALILAATIALASSTPADATTQGEGGSKPTCQIMGGYHGTCTNTGRVVEGVIYGCQTDFEGNYYYATLGASFHGGAIRMVLHKPWYDHHTFWNEGRSDISVKWDDGQHLSAPAIAFSMIREPGSPSAWIQRSWVSCCDCGQKKGQR